MKRQLFVFLLLVVFLAPSLRAAPTEVLFFVDSDLDEVDADTADGICLTAGGTCTLRAAVMQANMISGQGANIILPAGVYDLTRPAIGDNGPDNGDLNLTTPAAGDPLIVITGADAEHTIIDANGLDSVIHVAPKRTAVMTGVTIQGGYGDYGGGILNDGVLVIEESIITGNESSIDYGGGIHNDGSLALRSSTVTGNHSVTVGGGIFNSGTAVINFSAIRGNTANRGGGIYNAGELEMINAIIDENVADGEGGGIFNLGSSRMTLNVIAVNLSGLEGGGIYNHAIGTTFLSTSTVLGNTSGYVGGGLYNGGTTRINESTINANEANHGGGIVAAGPLILVNSTVSENRALLSGGGIYNQNSLGIYSSTVVLNEADADETSTGEAGGIYNDAAGSVSLRNTLLAYNHRAAGAVADECFGILVVHGRNLIGLPGAISEQCLIDWTNGEWEYTTSDSDQLGPLDDNGGPTWTHALSPDHDAIDYADTVDGCVDENLAPLAVDQRGGPRVVGPACDIGATEFGAISPTPTPPPASDYVLFLPMIVDH
jgi:hypothetical protein